MKSITNGLIAAIVPCALMLLAHYTLHQPDPPLIDAYTFILQWALIGIIVHTTRLPVSIFWSAVLWSLLIGWLGAAWGTYFGRDVLIGLLLPQLVCGLVMAPISKHLEKRSS